MVRRLMRRVGRFRRNRNVGSYNSQPKVFILAKHDRIRARANRQLALAAGVGA